MGNENTVPRRRWTMPVNRQGSRGKKERDYNKEEQRENEVTLISAPTQSSSLTVSHRETSTQRISFTSLSDYAGQPLLAPGPIEVDLPDTKTIALPSTYKLLGLNKIEVTRTTKQTFGYSSIIPIDKSKLAGCFDFLYILLTKPLKETHTDYMCTLKLERSMMIGESVRLMTMAIHGYAITLTNFNEHVEKELETTSKGLVMLGDEPSDYNYAIFTTNVLTKKFVVNKLLPHFPLSDPSVAASLIVAV